jgi:hypothetical protein
MVTDNASLKRRASRLWKRDELPREFEWMNQLTPLHYRLCVVELHAAMGQAHLTGDWNPVIRLMEDWEATARVDSDPALSQILLASNEYEEYGT